MYTTKSYGIISDGPPSECSGRDKSLFVYLAIVVGILTVGCTYAIFFNPNENRHRYDIETIEVTSSV